MVVITLLEKKFKSSPAAAQALMVNELRSFHRLPQEPLQEAILRYQHLFYKADKEGLAQTNVALRGYELIEKLGF